MEEPRHAPPAQAPDHMAVAPPDENHPKVEPSAHQPAPPKPKAKSTGNGVTGAIIATVIIILGLAAMAVYAYLKQK